MTAPVQLPTSPRSSFINQQTPAAQAAPAPKPVATAAPSLADSSQIEKAPAGSPSATAPAPAKLASPAPGKVLPQILQLQEAAAAMGALPKVGRLALPSLMGVGVGFFGLMLISPAVHSCYIPLIVGVLVGLAVHTAVRSLIRQSHNAKVFENAVRSYEAASGLKLADSPLEKLEEARKINDFIGGSLKESLVACAYKPIANEVKRVSNLVNEGLKAVFAKGQTSLKSA